MIWKPITGWPYEVSDSGLVRRIGAIGGLELTPMRMGQKRKQYSVVALCNNGNELRRKVHHLVLEAFIGPRPLGQFALHRDDDTTNNSLVNLYWGTYEDNANDARFKGSKLTPKQIAAIKTRRARGERGRYLANEYGVSEQLICDIYKGRCYQWSDE